VSELRATDGDLDTRWMSPTAGTQKPWIIVQRNPNDPTPTCRVDIAWADGDGRKYKFDIDISSADHSTWTNVLSNKESTGTTTGFETYTFQPKPAKYVKITINETTPGGVTVVAQISELRYLVTHSKYFCTATGLE
jgi:hypothetical protein